MFIPARSHYQCPLLQTVARAIAIGYSCETLHTRCIMPEDGRDRIGTDRARVVRYVRGAACPVPRRRHRGVPEGVRKPRADSPAENSSFHTPHTTHNSKGICMGYAGNQASPHRRHNHLVYLVLLLTARVRPSPFTTSIRRYSQGEHKVRAARLWLSVHPLGSCLLSVGVLNRLNLRLLFYFIPLRRHGSHGPRQQARVHRFATP
jgi:hypothetical protein